MENELTPHTNLPYPVDRTSMDDNIEQSQPQAQETASKKETEEEKKIREERERLARISNVRKERARKAWEEENKRREAKGEKITDEEREIQRQEIERGRGPIGGGSGDGKFENFDAEKYKGTSLEEAAKKLKQAGENNSVTPELLKEIQDISDTVAGLGNEALAQEFVEDFRRAQQENLGGNIPNPDNGGGEQDLNTRLREFSFNRERRSSTPSSIQEVARTIILDEGEDRWGENGAFPLLDSENHINQANFLRWFRERVLYQHTNNSRNINLELGNMVGIVNEFGSTVSIFSMDSQRAKYFQDATNGEILDKLADQLKNELFLFGKIRQYDLMYQDAMGSDTSLPELLGKIHNLEELTNPGNLRSIMKMPKDYGKDGDTTVGDAVRKAYEIYYYASDFEELQKILGKESIFFKKEGFENAFRILEKKQKGGEIGPDAKVFIDKIFKNGVLDRGAFISEMNPYNAQNKPEFNKNIMREMVRQAISEKYGFEYGLDKSIEPTRGPNGKVRASKRDSERRDLEYAEWWAWIMTRLTGAGARNDVEAVGFDSFTKLLKFQDYRVRQSRESRAGQFGNQYDLPVFKSLVREFFNGITIEKRAEDKGANLTPFEVFRILDDKEDQINRILQGRKEEDLTQDELLKVNSLKAEKSHWFDRLGFEQSAQKGYAQNHLNRSFELFHSMMGAEELRLDEIVKWDPFQGVIMDRGKFEEQVKEKFLKPMRYAFSTYPQLDFGKMTRVQKKFNEDGTPKYVDITVAEAMFGPEVVNSLRPLAEEYWKKKRGEVPKTKEERWSAYLSDSSSEGGRSKLWKKAAMARLALDLKSHREHGSGYQHFNREMIEEFYDALKTIKAVDILGEEEDETIMKYGKSFFTKEDIEWIRKHSKTGFGRMLFTDVIVKDGGLGLLKGTWGGVGAFMKEIFR